MVRYFRFSVLKAHIGHIGHWKICTLKERGEGARLNFQQLTMNVTSFAILFKNEASKNAL